MDAESSQACKEDAEPIRSVTCSREERHVLQLCAQPTHCEREDRPRAVASVTAMRRCRSARPSRRDPAPAPAVYRTVRFSHKPVETLLYAYSVLCSLSRPQMCKRINHSCQKSGDDHRMEETQKRPARRPAGSICVTASRMLKMRHYALKSCVEATGRGYKRG